MRRTTWVQPSKACCARRCLPADGLSSTTVLPTRPPALLHVVCPRTCHFVQHYRRQRDGAPVLFCQQCLRDQGRASGRSRRLDYDFLAVLDADITFAPGLLRADFRAVRSRPRVGSRLGRSTRTSSNGRLETVIHDRRSTPKAIQVFRRSVLRADRRVCPAEARGARTPVRASWPACTAGRRGPFPN
jgi:hypothetical protein